MEEREEKDKLTKYDHPKQVCVEMFRQYFLNQHRGIMTSTRRLLPVQQVTVIGNHFEVTIHLNSN